MTTAEGIIGRLSAQGATVAVAESLTGGLVCGALTAVPGASACVAGGVVAYAERLKSQMLGVDADLVERHGAVDPQVAAQMAEGVRAALGSTYGVATTGAAGPDAAPGGTQAAPVAPGTAYVAVAGPRGTQVRRLDLAGSRAEIRDRAVVEALDCLSLELDRA
ncbi:MAG: CinA family protein [Candidatus Nanopelagicales bacterium]